MHRAPIGALCEGSSMRLYIACFDNCHERSYVEPYFSPFVFVVCIWRIRTNTSHMLWRIQANSSHVWQIRNWKNTIQQSSERAENEICMKSTSNQAILFLKNHRLSWGGGKPGWREDSIIWMISKNSRNTETGLKTVQFIHPNPIRPVLNCKSFWYEKKLREKKGNSWSLVWYTYTPVCQQHSHFAHVKQFGFALPVGNPDLIGLIRKMPTLNPVYLGLGNFT